ncbi:MULTISPECIES: alpha-glucosidase [unclassified Roseitalea]|uniref:beta-galactosidase BglA n=1 Tax=unclassified Roseitalea TaxID=2639107 RepID=UPI00273E5926|nr:MULTISPECIES: alpha-glucosidase [unclassified Roseitalea]
MYDFPSDRAPGLVTSHETDRDWWRGAVIYQIYPRSFQDTDGDGIGDLRGVTRRLPYVASLGVDAIWISPFFASPMLDFGYDVADYKAVDPMFGTLADFDGMIAEAHRLGLKVMIDQVISHTSDQHEWFAESRSSRDNPRADWYVWADAKPDGTAPNNWLSVFGGSAWEWDTSRRQYYLHNFLKSQPDLNFHNPEVQDALLDAVRFWLDRGVDGFRLDTINFYFHSAGLEDNPPLAPELRNSLIAPEVNPYNYQDHRFDKNQAENVAFLRRFRALLDEYPAAAAVGEVGDAQYGLQLVSDYTSGEDKIHMCYSFDFLAPSPITATRVREVIEEFERVAPDGWSCWAFSNHDVVRHASRWADMVIDRDGFLKMAATLILSLRGSVCLYQGEELGLTEAVLDYDDLQDPYGIQFWPTFKGRDGCRTPMVWSHNEPNGGFTEGKPWLPVPYEHLNCSVDRQSGGSETMLGHYRAMLAFRARHRVFAKGTIEFHGDSHDVLTFTRRNGEDEILAVINMTERPAEVDIGAGHWNTLAGNPHTDFARDGRKLTLGGYSAYFAERQK